MQSHARAKLLKSKSLKALGHLLKIEDFKGKDGCASSMRLLACSNPARILKA